MRRQHLQAKDIVEVNRISGYMTNKCIHWQENICETDWLAGKWLQYHAIVKCMARPKGNAFELMLAEHTLSLPVMVQKAVGL